MEGGEYDDAGDMELLLLRSAEADLSRDDADPREVERPRASLMTSSEPTRRDPICPVLTWRTCGIPAFDMTVARDEDEA